MLEEQSTKAVEVAMGKEAVLLMLMLMMMSVVVGKEQEGGGGGPVNKRHGADKQRKCTTHPRISKHKRSHAGKRCAVPGRW